ncbi:uncharacterized protein F4822DRAFT_356012 [Hypoxylon trugodes]|uniref:uncharacterized protein n=1 Tax=Hypoxylon trugodes TaxID=326681 RepID=UPI002190615E|nr:uncharacterized protein F4822DRAFT_356012 [Hypoxylon trugodes]KAI1385847.1 hypothetical protein F4822DRAFT_356012 [Hypoxylon trugodes]
MNQLPTLTSPIYPTVTPSLTAVWQLAPIPASLEASVIEKRSYSQGSESGFVVTYQVNCPATSSPENDACRELSIYPAEVYHTQGSVFGGTWTADSKDATTWRCELGDCSTCTASRAETADCSLTIRDASSSTRTETTKIESCYLAQHSVPLVLTAGAEKLATDDYIFQSNVGAFTSNIGDWLSTMGCEQRPTLQAASVSQTASVTDQPTGTVQSTSPTPSSAGNGWESRRLGYGFGAMSFLIASFFA